MKIAFVKMHGLGNDFVVIDAVRQPVHLTAQQVRHLSDRHFGVGCDQVLLVEPPQRDGADFRYRIFNSDGSEVAQCGNGARCFARFVREQGLSAADRIVADTLTGRLVLQLQLDGQVTVDMGVPKHAPMEVPLVMDEERTLYHADAAGEAVAFGAVSMGNPHAVMIVGDVSIAPVVDLGSLLEKHEIFPQKVNVGFMEVINPNHIRLRVFERGVGETLACGSGACAAVVVGAELGRLNGSDAPVRVDLPGGTLAIRWSGRGHSVFMTGPAETVFRGEIEL